MLCTENNFGNNGLKLLERIIGNFKSIMYSSLYIHTYIHICIHTSDAPYRYQFSPTDLIPTLFRYKMTDTWPISMLGT